MEKHFYLCNTQKENTSKARSSSFYCFCFEEIFSTESVTTLKGSFIHRRSRLNQQSLVAGATGNSDLSSVDFQVFDYLCH